MKGLAEVGSLVFPGYDTLFVPVLIGSVALQAGAILQNALAQSARLASPQNVLNADKLSVITQIRSYATHAATVWDVLPEKMKGGIMGTVALGIAWHMWNRSGQKIEIKVLPAPVYVRHAN